MAAVIDQSKHPKVMCACARADAPACGLYHAKFGVIRPPELWGDGKSVKKRKASARVSAGGAGFDGKRKRKSAKFDMGDTGSLALSQHDHGGQHAHLEHGHHESHVQVHAPHDTPHPTLATSMAGPSSGAADGGAPDAQSLGTAVENMFASVV